MVIKDHGSVQDEDLLFFGFVVGHKGVLVQFKSITGFSGFYRIDREDINRGMLKKEDDGKLLNSHLESG
jgi:hypothetical protein